MRRFLLGILFFPFFMVSAQGLNAGFVQGVWYSKTPFFAGETVRVYTAIQNNSGSDIQGTLEFLVNENSVGESVFSIINGRIVEVWTDWKVTQGNHSVQARIKEAFLVEIGKTPEPISLDAGILEASEVFVDLDTDQDGIGNMEDDDDDNDGLTDQEEEILQTDPLNPDTDGDGVSDQKEVQAGTNPLVANRGDATKEQQEVTAAIEPPKESVFEKVITLMNEEYIPAIEHQIDKVVESAVQELQGQKQKLQEKKESFDAGENPEPLSLGEQSLYFLLTASIVALPQWQIGLFLFFAIAAALLLRRLAKKE